MWKSVLNANEFFPSLFSSSLFYMHSHTRYDILSDGLDDVVIDNAIITQATLEDEEALDPIDNLEEDDDIWHGENTNHNITAFKNTNSYKLQGKVQKRPYVAYEPLNECDSHKINFY